MGRQAGQPVDFYALPQTYGDEYDEHQGLIVPESEQPIARKQLRDGRLVIVQNRSIFTPLGQRLQ